jgi:hypothetical protein
MCCTLVHAPPKEVPMIHPHIDHQTSPERWRIGRRTWLKGIGIAVAVSVLPELAAGTPRVMAYEQHGPTAMLLRSGWAQLQGETFHVQHGAAQKLVLQLARVRDLRSQARMSANVQTSAYCEACFSLVFHGPGDMPLDQGTYQFEHRRVGSFALFITPLFPDANARYYETVFNSPPR